MLVSLLKTFNVCHRLPQTSITITYTCIIMIPTLIVLSADLQKSDQNLLLHTNTSQNNHPDYLGLSHLFGPIKCNLPEKRFLCMVGLDVIKYNEDYGTNGIDEYLRLRCVFHPDGAKPEINPNEVLLCNNPKTYSRWNWPKFYPISLELDLTIAYNRFPSLNLSYESLGDFTLYKVQILTISINESAHYANVIDKTIINILDPLLPADKLPHLKQLYLVGITLGSPKSWRSILKMRSLTHVVYWNSHDDLDNRLIWSKLLTIPVSPLQSSLKNLTTLILAGRNIKLYGSPHLILGGPTETYQSQVTAKIILRSARGQNISLWWSDKRHELRGNQRANHGELSIKGNLIHFDSIDPYKRSQHSKVLVKVVDLQIQNKFKLMFSRASPLRRMPGSLRFEFDLEAHEYEFPEDLMNSLVSHGVNLTHSSLSRKSDSITSRHLNCHRFCPYILNSTFRQSVRAQCKLCGLPGNKCHYRDVEMMKPEMRPISSQLNCDEFSVRWYIIESPYFLIMIHLLTIALIVSLLMRGYLGADISIVYASRFFNISPSMTSVTNSSANLVQASVTTGSAARKRLNKDRTQ